MVLGYSRMFFSRSLVIAKSWSTYWIITANAFLFSKTFWLFWHWCKHMPAHAIQARVCGKLAKDRGSLDLCDHVGIAKPLMAGGVKKVSTGVSFFILSQTQHSQAVFEAMGRKKREPALKGAADSWQTLWLRTQNLFQFACFKAKRVVVCAAAKWKPKA